MHRRLAAAAAAVLIASSLGGPATARPGGPAPRPAAATVDVSRLRALGLGPAADLVQSTIARELGGTGRIAVRLTGLSMSSYAGSDSGGGAGDSGAGGAGSGSSDYLEGDVLLLGPGGQIVAQRHQIVSSPASAGGAYYLPGVEQRRIEAVSRAFAGWALRATP